MTPLTTRMTAMIQRMNSMCSRYRDGRSPKRRVFERTMGEHHVRVSRSGVVSVSPRHPDGIGGARGLISSGDVVPVDDVPQRVEVLGLPVLVLEVVRVLPGIDREERDRPLPVVALMVVDLLD